MIRVPASSAGSLSATGCVVATFPGPDSALAAVDLPSVGDSLKILLILKEKFIKVLILVNQGISIREVYLSE